MGGVSWGQQGVEKQFVKCLEEKRVVITKKLWVDGLSERCDWKSESCWIHYHTHEHKQW